MFIRENEDLGKGINIWWEMENKWDMERMGEEICIGKEEGKYKTKWEIWNLDYLWKCRRRRRDRELEMDLMKKKWKNELRCEDWKMERK